MLTTEVLPPRLYTSEVLALAKFGPSKLRKKQKNGSFPFPVDRGRQDIYDTKQVLVALGIMDETHAKVRNDPFKKGLEKLGGLKR